ncbi:MAG: radical SAM protein [Desulfobacteraceae bacterium]|nr:radical SAM protein [Desulfobacteraceae bacterium]
MQPTDFIELSSRRDSAFHIYCQIPFCWYRCPHCCFVSMFDKKDLTDLSKIPEYVNSLVREIEYYEFPDRLLQSIVFGGGTPSLLTAKQAGKIINAVVLGVKRMHTEQFCMSYETTPELASIDKLKDFQAIGFNRVSIGIQSFIENDLKLLKRANSRSQAFSAVENAKKAGYEAVNIDLLGGFPGSSFDNWVENIKTALELDTECICINMMVYNYDSAPEYLNRMKKKGFSIPCFDERVRIYEYALSVLTAHGYEKVSYNLFCKPGFRYNYEISAVGQTDRAVCAFGSWVVSHLDNRIVQSLPFIREYIRQPLYKSMDCTYRQNAYQIIYGQLLCHGKARRELVEPLFGCTMEEAINESAKAKNLIEELLAREYAELGPEGLFFKREALAAGLILLWSY